MTVSYTQYTDTPTRPDTFADLFTEYRQALLRFVRRRFIGADADEVVQETMLRAMTHFDSIEECRDPWPWLCVVASNVARDHYRFRQRHQLFELTPETDVPDAQTTPPEQQVVAEEDGRLLKAALETIPPHQRAILLLREADEMTIPEIAQIVSSSENAVRQQLFRARKSLAREFLRLGGMPAFVGGLVAFVRFRRNGVQRVMRQVAAAEPMQQTPAFLGAGAVAVVAGAVVISALGAGGPASAAHRRDAATNTTATSLASSAWPKHEPRQSMAIERTALRPVHRLASVAAPSASTPTSVPQAEVTHGGSLDPTKKGTQAYVRVKVEVVPGVAVIVSDTQYRPPGAVHGPLCSAPYVHCG